MKVIALYLPQYHEIKENNEWWGEGFTEWTNVKRAKALFEGHYQPRIPLNDNYYCLLDGNQTFKWQINLAKKYGIYGFCMYHYWFNGKLLLEKPLENWLNDKTLDFPYCICWANENWTNGWVSSENRILISHDYGDKNDWVQHFNYLLPFLKDERYIRIDDKPLIGIYVPDLMGNYLNEFIACWRKLAIENGLPGLTIFYQSVRTFLTQSCDKMLCDYGIEFQPGFSKVQNMSRISKWKLKVIPLMSKILQEKFHVYIHKKKAPFCAINNYDEMWDKIIRTKPSSQKMIPGAFVDWDNTARKGTNGDLYVGVSPQKFGKYMSIQIKRAREVYRKDYIFLFAWNEWGECGYLEPDERYKYGYLEALRSALIENNEFPVWPS